MQRMVILDRDGVINEDSDDYIKSAEEWLPIPGSIEAISRLKKAGFLVTVATNQAAIARGVFDLETLQQMHQKLSALLEQQGVALDGIYFCPHRPEDNCSCRKPKPGMLLNIARDFSIDLKATPFVGDNISDLQAAGFASAQPVLVKTGKGERTLQNQQATQAVPVYDNLAHFVREYLKENG